MEFKKKTIIWEDNNEPPKDYIWAKKDGKFYEYSHTTRSWVESKSISGGNSGDSDDGGGGSSDTDINQELEFLSQITNLIYQTQGFVFDADSIQNWCVPISDYDESWSEGKILLGNKETADCVMWVNNESEENFYTVFLTEEEYNYLSTTVDVEKRYFRDWTKNKFAFPIMNYLLQNGNNFNISNGWFDSDDGRTIPGLKLVDAGCLLFGTTQCNLLGKDFLDDTIGKNLQIPETKFTFAIPSEGIYSCFVFANYDKFTETIITNLNNLQQRVCKASETDDGEIYLVELSGIFGTFYTLYYKSKNHDWH